jgi:hypothetical protein
VAKLTLNSITSGYLPIPLINDNSNRIITALENTLSRDGTTPNTMGATLDMNSNRIINLASPLSNSDAARWIDVVNSVVLTGTAIPSQVGNADKVITTNGTNISWRSVQDLLGFPGSISKGDILVGTAVNTLTRKAVGTNGQLIVADSTQSDGLIWTDYTREPLNVNPNWLLDQINEGVLYTVNGVDVRGPDGWSGNAVGTGVFKLRTIADPDNAALRCLEITCTTADAAIGAADSYQLYSVIEGYDVAGLNIGTASASQLTVMFKFKTNVLGTYGVALANAAGNRANIGIITVADANEHSYSLPFTLDTAGVWLYTNGVGLAVVLSLAQGANFQSTAGNWGAGAGRTTAAQCNFMSANTNIAYLKRIHVIPSGVALAYHMQDFSRELRKAQRYYEKSYDQGTAVANNVGSGVQGANFFAVDTSNATGTSPFKVTKRATPTMLSWAPVSGIASRARDATSGLDVVTTGVGSADQTGFGLATSAAAFTVGRVYSFQWASNARLS